MNNYDRAVKLEVVRNLGHNSKYLAEFINDEDESVRGAVAHKLTLKSEALAYMAVHDVLHIKQIILERLPKGHSLVEIMSEDQDYRVRAQCARLLSGDSPRFLEMLGDRSAQVRKQILQRMWTEKTPGIEGLLNTREKYNGFDFRDVEKLDPASEVFEFLAENPDELIRVKAAKRISPKSKYVEDFVLDYSRDVRLAIVDKVSFDSQLYGILAKDEWLNVRAKAVTLLGLHRPDSVFMDIFAKDGNREIREIVARHTPVGSPVFMSLLTSGRGGAFPDEEQKVQAILVRRMEDNSPVFTTLTSNCGKDLGVAIAEKVSKDSHILYKLANNRHYDVQAAVIKKLDPKSEILRMLSKSEYAGIRQEVARVLDPKSQILADMYKDPDNNVKALVASRLDPEAPELEDMSNIEYQDDRWYSEELHRIKNMAYTRRFTHNCEKLMGELKAKY